MTTNWLIVCLTLVVITVQYCQGFENITNVLVEAEKKLQNLKNNNLPTDMLLCTETPVAFYGNISNDIKKIGNATKMMLYQFEKGQARYRTYEDMVSTLTRSVIATAVTDMIVQQSDIFIKKIKKWDFKKAPQDMKNLIASWIEKYLGKNLTEKFQFDAKHNAYLVEYVANILQDMKETCSSSDRESKETRVVLVPFVLYPTLKDEKIRLYKITLDAWLQCGYVNHDGGLVFKLDRAAFGPRTSLINRLDDALVKKIVDRVDLKYSKL